MTTDTKNLSDQKTGMFVTSDGKNVMFTFALVSSLFLLWGLLNGMIDVMDKHFQEELHLTLAQSATVQFAHYLGYFLMAMPAGWLAIRLGYKGGIIAGLLLVAVGGIWFIPATQISAFWAFLLGVCLIASGLTFLETIANPYTTVLGNPRYAATRINLAQSCNGIGWFFGPIIGGLFFYGTDAAGKSTGSQTLYIPYVAVAIIVVLLAIVFYFANVPDIKPQDDYHIEDKHADAPAVAPDRKVNRLMVYLLLLANAVTLTFICGQILGTILTLANVMTPSISHTITIVECAIAAILVIVMIPTTGKVTHHSMWSHPHFSAATLAQFLYVAAQCGIFSFFINYMTSQVPPIPKSWKTSRTEKLIEIHTTLTATDITDLPAFVARLKQKADPVSAFLAGRLSKETTAKLNEFNPSSGSKALQVVLVQDLNKVIKQNPKDLDKKISAKDQVLHDVDRFGGISLSAGTKDILAKKPEGVNLARLNRMLLVDAFPQQLAFKDNVLGISDKGASFLASLGFFCFLAGRFSGAGLLRKYSAHKILGLYALLNVVVCFLIFAKLGWFSVACVFLSYFFMSIMFPTIFALGIFGLGAKAKSASAYIVMAIMGGAILPKLMGSVADNYDMSRSFIVPLVCFALVAGYGFFWSAFSGAKSLHTADVAAGH